MGLIDKHENQHKADYQTYFVDMVNLRYDRYYCKYLVAYCVNGNPDHANMAVKDLKAMIDMRKKAFEDSYGGTKAYDAFNASANRLDAFDYPNIKLLLEAFGFSDKVETIGEIWEFPLWSPENND